MKTRWASKLEFNTQRGCQADTTKAWSVRVENKGIHSVCVVFCTWLPLVKSSAWVHVGPSFPSVYVLLTSKSCFKKSNLFIYTGRRRMLWNAGCVAKSYIYPQWPKPEQRDSNQAKRQQSGKDRREEDIVLFKVYYIYLKINVYIFM